MNEIYWLTRIGVIGDVCVIFAIIGIILIALMTIFLPLILDTVDEKENWKAFFKKYGKVFAILWFISLLGCIFVPTKKEMIAIYGIGTTIDYIKSNDKAKQLPDKAVDALTKYLEDINKEEKD